MAEKAGARCFRLKQLWAPHKLEDKNWFSFLDYQEVGASRSGNLTLSWPAGLDCSQTCSILKRIVWDGREGGVDEKSFGIFCAHWYLTIFFFFFLRCFMVLAIQYLIFYGAYLKDFSPWVTKSDKDRKNWRLLNQGYRNNNSLASEGTCKSLDHSCAIHMSVNQPVVLYFLLLWWSNICVTPSLSKASKSLHHYFASTEILPFTKGKYLQLCFKLKPR